MNGADAVRAGEVAEEAGDFAEAMAAYRTALDDPDPRVVADAHFHLGRASWRQGRFDAAIEGFGAARSIAVGLGANDIRAQAENGMGAVFYARGAYAQARAAYYVALEFTADAVMRAKILLNLGVIANIEGDLDGARGIYMRSRATFAEAGDQGGEILALHNLGMLHADRHEWDEAEEVYKRCLELCELRGNRPMIASVLINRSELSCAREAFENAIADCDLAIAICAETGDEVQRGEASRWKGHALRRMGHHALAELALRDAVRIARRTQVKLLEAEAARELATSAAARADDRLARKWYDRALTLFDDLGARRESAEVRAERDRLTGG
jgi:tetratricopeptide (TPR) repeat protein